MPLYNLHTKIMLAHTPMLIGDLESNTYTISESAGFLIRNIVTILTVIGIFVLIFIIVLLIKLLNRKPQNKIIKKKKAIKKRK
ncbi:hypothetical protein KKG31_03825 [Patescibacteria group bacterium]|nr:hypothetical protein [Patescibacteria group bacterium]MBU1758272.1 hypothetical protein [Patescibacteria group bacterium]